MKKNLIILNYASGVCSIYTVDDMEDYETYITEELGFNLSNCHWMVTEQDIEYN